MGIWGGISKKKMEFRNRKEEHKESGTEEGMSLYLYRKRFRGHEA